MSQLAPPPPLSRGGGVWTTPSPFTVDSYKPLSRLSLVIRCLVGVFTIVALVIIGLSLVLWRTLGETSIPTLGLPSVDADWVMLDQWVRRLAIAEAVLVGIICVLTITWTRRGYRNLGCLGVTGRRLAPFWATFGWLVPGVNLIVPKLVVDDIWRASDADIASGSSRWRSTAVPTANHMWWITTIVALPTAALALATFLTTGDRPVDLAEIHATQGSLLVLAVAEILVVFAAVLFNRTVSSVTERQRARAARLGPAARPWLPTPEPEPVIAPLPSAAKGPVLLHSAGTGAGAGRY